MPYPPLYVVEPIDGFGHTHTIILLHGRSSTAKEFATDIFALNTSSEGENLRSHFPGFRWVFPDAGNRWCTPFKEERSAWFDTFSLEDLRGRQDLQVSGLRDGIQLVRDIVEKEVRRLGGDASKVILGGFSQGSATALWALFTGAAMTRGSLGAFVGLSAWMPFTKEATEAVGDDVVNTTSNRIQRLGDSFLDIVGIEHFVSTEAMQACLQMPVYLGHGTDVCNPDTLFGWQ